MNRKSDGIQAASRWHAALQAATLFASFCVSWGHPKSTPELVAAKIAKTRKDFRRADAREELPNRFRTKDARPSVFVNICMAHMSIVRTDP